MDRFRTYKFFAHLLSYPYGEIFFKNLEYFFPFGNREILEDFKNIPLNEIQAEYTSLFEFYPGGAPCKPYQSVFEGEGLLMGEAAVNTAKYYTLFGLDSGSEYPDRASLQLDFMAFLLKLLEELQDNKEKKRVEILIKEFFKKHIAWMENLAECVIRRTQLEPLKVFMGLFKEFLEREKLLLNI